MNQQFTLFPLTFAHAEFRRDIRRTLDNFVFDGRWRQGGGLWPPVRATPIREELCGGPISWQRYLSGCRAAHRSLPLLSANALRQVFARVRTRCRQTHKAKAGDQLQYVHV